MDILTIQQVATDIQAVAQSDSVSRWLEIGLAVLGTGTITTIITQFFGRKQSAANTNKTDAETEGQVTDNYEKLVARLEGEVQRLTETVAKLTEKVSTLEKRDRVFVASIMRSSLCEKANKDECPIMRYYLNHVLPDLGDEQLTNNELQ